MKLLISTVVEVQWCGSLISDQIKNKIYELPPNQLPVHVLYVSKDSKRQFPHSVKKSLSNEQYYSFTFKQEEIDQGPKEKKSELELLPHQIKSNRVPNLHKNSPIDN